MDTIITTTEEETMRVEIRSPFHGTTITTNVKPAYGRGSVDILSALDYESWSHGPDADYARRKLAEIKRGLCGQPDCKCIFTVVAYNLPM